MSDVSTGASRHPLVRAFIVIAVIEAITWACLLVGMYFKYVPQTTELGVRIFGSLHGAAFIAYGVVTLLVARRLSWSVKVTLLALAASIPPFMTAVFEWWAKRRGLLDEPITSSDDDRVADTVGS